MEDHEALQHWKQQLNIHPDMIEEEIQKAPAILDEANTGYHKAFRRQGRLKLALRQEEARLMIMAKAAGNGPTGDPEVDEMVAQCGGKTTDKITEAVVRNHSRYEAAYIESVDAEADLALWHGRVDTAKCKRDMLKELNSRYNSISKIDPSVYGPHKDNII
jgi:hypothetical protein